MWTEQSHCWNVGTYWAGVLHHCVSEPVVSLCFELQIVGALEDYSFLKVACPLVPVAHRVLAVVGDGLGCLFGEQADESHLNCDGVCRLIFVAISKLEKKNIAINTQPHKNPSVSQDALLNTQQGFHYFFPKMWLFCTLFEHNFLKNMFTRFFFYKVFNNFTVSLQHPPSLSPIIKM